MSMSSLTIRVASRFSTRTPLRAASRLPTRSSLRFSPLVWSRLPIASFNTSPVRAALSESDHDHPDREKVIEEHKQDQLRKQKEGKGEWKKELSSNSEAAVKADRGEVGAADISQLQKETEKAAEESHDEAKK